MEIRITIAFFLLLPLFGCLSDIQDIQNLSTNDTMNASLSDQNASGQTIQEPESTAESPNRDLIERTIASYNESNSSSFDNVNLLLDTEPEEMIPLLESDDPYKRWTALYILTSTAHKAANSTKEDIEEALKPYVDGEQGSFRFLAGLTLITMGDQEGTRILIESLDDKSILALSEPPSSICDQSYGFLIRYTAIDNGYPCLDSDEGKGNLAAWRIWYHTNSDSLRWDESKGMMVVG